MSETVQLFSVPNDEEGRKFIADAKRYLAKGYRIVKRGRTPVVSGGKHQTLRLSECRNVGLYITLKDGTRISSYSIRELERMRGEYWQAMVFVRNVKEAIRNLTI